MTDHLFQPGIGMYPMQPAELPQLEEMVLALYEEDQGGLPMTRQKIRNTLVVFSKKPERGQIVLFKEGKAPIGYAMLVNYWSNEFGGDILFIDELYIKQPWRKRGISTRFFELLAAERSPTVKALQLEVGPTNEKAFAFYRRLGFQPHNNRFLIKVLE